MDVRGGVGGTCQRRRLQVGESGSLEQPQSQDAATGRERRPTYVTPPPSTLLLFAQQMEGRVVVVVTGGQVTVEEGWGGGPR